MEFKLNVTKKDGKNNPLRKKGFVPAVLYGFTKENQNLQVAKNEFEKIYEKGGKSTIINLTIEKGKEIPVIVRDVQKDYLKNNEIIHIDFYQVDMNKKVIVEVPLVFVGKSEAVKNGGILVNNIEKIKIKVLPADLMSTIEIDLAKLKLFTDKIKVSDLNLSDKVSILTDLNTLIVGVLPVKEKGKPEKAAGADAKKKKK